jgi:hypothetical protein
MRVGLHDADKTSFPNLALMKLSAAYKAKGADVEFFDTSKVYDKVVSSKVFTFTPNPVLPEGSVCGGVGYGVRALLPEWVEHLCPDYNLYGLNYSMGFTTRGCPNKCSFCIVPEKEGDIRAHADVEEFLKHKDVVLLDNNVLANDHGILQIEKLARLGVRVDYNQGLDARRVDDGVARRLAALKWLHPIRLACDSPAMHEPVRRAVEQLRWHNATPRQYFCYMLVTDVEQAVETARFLKGIYVDPFAQPFIPPDGTPPTREQRRFARWVNTKQVFKSVTWEAYKTERGDRI